MDRNLLRFRVMPDTIRLTVGDFIEIPAWHVSGQVTAIRPSIMGSEDSVTVLVQTSPDDELGHWYRVEPDEYRVL